MQVPAVARHGLAEASLQIANQVVCVSQDHPRYDQGSCHIYMCVYVVAWLQIKPVISSQTIYILEVYNHIKM